MSSMVDISIDEPKQGVIIVNIKGHYSLENLELVEAHLSDAFSKAPDIFAINCSDTSYIDSTGLGSLVKFYNASLRENVKFILYNLNTEIRRIIEIAGLGKFFDIQTKEEFQKKYL